MIKKKNFIAVLICIMLFSGFSSTLVGAQNRLLIVVDVQRAFYENTSTGSSSGLILKMSSMLKPPQKCLNFRSCTSEL
jgi:hypothetical protein